MCFTRKCWLTSIHALTYGTPVATHSDFQNQMPEAAAIIDNINGFFFKRDDEYDLAKKIKNWLIKKNVNKKKVRSSR